MRFEWDDEKNAENIRKHGIDFADAVQIFAGPLLEAVDARYDYGEDRFIGIGLLGNRTVVVVYTERGSDVIRIISARKALSHEAKRFADHLRDRLGPG